MAGRLDDVDVEQTFFVGVLHRLEHRRALGDGQLLVLEVVDLVELGVGAHQDARAGDVVRNGEGHLLAALGVVGGGAALQIGLALHDGLHPVGRGHRQVAHLQLGQVELALDRVRHLQAQVQRIAHRLAAGAVDVGQGHRGIAMGQDDLAALADALEHRAGDGAGALGGQQHGQRHQGDLLLHGLRGGQACGRGCDRPEGVGGGTQGGQGESMPFP